MLKDQRTFPCFKFPAHTPWCLASQPFYLLLREELTGHVCAASSQVTGGYLQWRDISLPTRGFGTNKNEGPGLDSLAHTLLSTVIWDAQNILPGLQLLLQKGRGLVSSPLSYLPASLGCFKYLRASQMQPGACTGSWPRDAPSTFEPLLLSGRNLHLSGDLATELQGEDAALTQIWVSTA